MGIDDLLQTLPADLKNELEDRMKSGEFKSIDELIGTALKYYFERHSSKDMANYVDEEIHAGFDGSA